MGLLLGLSHLLGAFMHGLVRCLLLGWLFVGSQVFAAAEEPYSYWVLNIAGFPKCPHCETTFSLRAAVGISAVYNHMLVAQD
jgi:hypothetical protein